MRVHYMSDLHLEFAPAFDPPETDVLVLAGDVTVARCLDDRFSDEAHRDVRERTLAFFAMARQRARLGVIYVTGNHEPYGYDINESQAILRNVLAGDGVHVLENEAVEFEGIALLCCTLWTDMDRRNPVALQQIGTGLSDFHVIALGDATFTPSDAADLHDRSRAWLKDELTRRSQQPCIVVTHHAPSYQGINPAHTGSPLNPGFASDLEEIIVENDNIRAWIFGHTHVRARFEIAGSRILSNAAGYPGRERAGWNPDVSFTIAT